MAKVKEPVSVYEKYKKVEQGHFKSGIPLFDLVLTNGEGIPKGKFIELTSGSGLGKSTVLLHVCNYLANKLKRKAAYLDFEEGVSENIMSKMKLIDPFEDGSFMLMNPVTFANTEECFDEILNDKEIDVVVVDSITAIMPGKFKDKSVEDVDIGSQARMQSVLLQKYKYEFKKAGKTVFFVTQRRTNINIRYPSQTREKSAAGKAFEFYMDIRVELRGVGKITKKLVVMGGKKDVEQGQNVEFTAFKNRCGGAVGVPIQIPIIWGKGVSNVLATGHILVDAGLVKQSGSYFVVNFGPYENLKFQGYTGYSAFLKENLVDITKHIQDNNLMFLYRLT